MRSSGGFQHDLESQHLSTTRLPASLKAALEKLSKQDETSINQFVVMAVAEKVSAMETAAFFEARAALGDRKAFRRILNRKGDEI